MSRRDRLRPQWEPAMPSPFPGMDPFLEDPTVWPSFHHEIISDWCAAINQALPIHYVALPGERVVIEDPTRNLATKAYEPDVTVMQRQRDLAGPRASSGVTT